MRRRRSRTGSLRRLQSLGGAERTMMPLKIHMPAAANRTRSHTDLHGARSHGLSIAKQSLHFLDGERRVGNDTHQADLLQRPGSEQLSG